MSQQQRKPKRSPKGQRSAEQRTVAAAESEGTHDIEREHQTPEQAGVEASTVEHEDGDINWMRPSNLDAPPPRPGMVQRWIRNSLGGAQDVDNWRNAMREGWRPVPASEVDEKYAPMRGELDGQGVISAGGLILCEMPKRAADQRASHYRDRTVRQMQGVEQDLHRSQSAGGPAIQRTHDSSAEQGRRPTVAGD